MELKEDKLISNLTWKSLTKIKHAFNVSTKWDLMDSEAPLYCEEIIRVVPGKRLLAFGLWSDLPVAIKIFYEKGRAKTAYEKEVRGVFTLTKHKVPTPNILYQGHEDKKRVYIVIYERITESESLYDIWQNKKSLNDLLPLLRSVTIELATQHVLGILQKDLHLKNFLITEKTIYTLDGGQVLQFDGPLDEETSIEYLSLFLAQFGVGVNEIQDALFDLYTKSRGWIVKNSDIKHFKKILERKKEERGVHYMKKVFRTCTQLVRMSQWGRNIYYERSFESSEFLKFLQNPDAVFKDPSATFLKRGHSSTVVKTSIDGRNLVVKRYNIKSFLHRLRRAFRPTRAAKSWRLAQLLTASGVKTAKPVAFIEHRFLSIRGKSYFVMEYVNGLHMGEYFSACKAKSQSLLMADKILRLIQNLKILKLTNHDLKMTNILIENDEPYLIDLDGMREHHNNLSLEHGMKIQIRRLMKNWENNSEINMLYKKALEHHGLPW